MKERRRRGESERRHKEVFSLNLLCHDNYHATQSKPATTDNKLSATIVLVSWDWHDTEQEAYNNWRSHDNENDEPLHFYPDESKQMIFKQKADMLSAS